MQASSTDTYMDAVIQEKQEVLFYSWSKNTHDIVKTQPFFRSKTIFKRLKKNPCNLIHLYIETKNILHMKQLQMIDTSLGLGKRGHKQTLKTLPYPSLFTPHNQSTSFRQAAQKPLLWWNTSVWQLPVHNVGHHWVIVLFPLWLESIERKVVSWAEQ